MIDTKQNTEKLLQFIAEKFQNNELDNESMVQLIELAGAYLNLATIPNYCKREKISYNGAKKNRTVKEIFGVKFIIDNI